jgi:hypothetical protein
MEWSPRATWIGAMVLIFLAEAAVSAFAGGAPKVVVRPGGHSIPMQATASGALSVGIVDLSATPSLTSKAAVGGEVLDLGTVSYAGSKNSNVSVEQHHGSFTVTTAFGLQVRDSSQLAHFATVSAFVVGSSSQLTYIVDGRKLSSTPTVIVPHLAVGGVTRHRLEVEVPTSLTERNAQQQVALQFEVTPN